MSSDTDHPRQRTVAELLAENAGSTTGRRRRRREADDPGDGAAAPDGRGAARTPPAERNHSDTVAPPARPATRPPSDPARLAGYRGAQGLDRGGPDRPGPAQPAPERPPAPRRAPFEGAATVPEVRPASVAPQAPPAAPDTWAPEPGRAPRRQPPPRTSGTDAPAPRRADEQRNPWAPDRATQQLPRVDRREQDRRERDERDPARRDDDTGPIDAPRAGLGAPPRRVPPDGGPPTMLGAPPVDDEPRTRGDGGPPTAAAAFDPDDLHDDDYAAPGDVRGADDADDHAGLDGLTTALPAGGRRPTDDGADDAVDEDDEDDPPEQPTTAVRAPHRSRRDRPAGLDARDADEDPADDEALEAAPQTWAAVIGQWIGGAVVGAGLWVGFAFLWMHLPVVALAAAVLVTVGLVLAVRAMLRDDNLRTTIFAVLVGLLLTVSPAILVLARQQV